MLHCANLVQSQIELTTKTVIPHRVGCESCGMRMDTKMSARSFKPLLNYVPIISLVMVLHTYPANRMVVTCGFTHIVRTVGATECFVPIKNDVAPWDRSTVMATRVTSKRHRGF